MPAVFVHGNPETPAVWTPLLAELDRDDVLTPRLPGFGVPSPKGFGATMDEYVDWLVQELEAVGEPVDLVGHDWGGGFVLRIACTRPELLRSWVSDVAGLLDADYVWHDMAQIWQTPGAGEEAVAAAAAMPKADLAALLTASGVTQEAASDFAAAFDDEMGRCVLALYRSAAQPAMREWGADVAAAGARPGLVITGTADPFTGGPHFSERMAEQLGARFESLDDLGHWWMLEDPPRGAAVIEEFWRSIA